MKKIALLGSTGSIGQSTLSLCESHPDRFVPVALAAGTNLDAAFAQCQRWRPQLVSIATEELADALTLRLKQSGITGIEVVYGTAGTVRVATLPAADFVVSAIVGVAGLEATYAAVLAGKQVGLANKECLVAAGDLILAAAREHSVDLLPIDSEHNAIHQCLRAGTANEVKQIWLTASGGPFRNTPLADFEHITPAQALKHPTWVMGRRITVDSATMLNKGLEIIEACRLFNLPPTASRSRFIRSPPSTPSSSTSTAPSSRRSPSPTCASPSSTPSPGPSASPPINKTHSPSTWPPSVASTSSSPTLSASPAFDWPMKRQAHHRTTASPSTRRMRSPSKPSSTAASPSSAFRVPLRRCWRSPSPAHQRLSPRS